MIVYGLTFQTEIIEIANIAVICKKIGFVVFVCQI